MRVEDGYMVLNQDANWNVTSATDLAGRVLERTFHWHRLRPPTFTSQTIFGEYGERSKPPYHQVLRVGPGFRIPWSLRQRRCVVQPRVARSGGLPWVRMI